MRGTDKRYPSYLAIWMWLMVLLALSLAFVVLPFSHISAVVLIFAVAAVKALLIARHYMHLREQPWMIHVIAGVPVLLVIAMALALIPDIALRPSG